MDDTTKNQNQDNNQVQQPVNPVGSAQKEVEVGPVSDYVSPSETSPKIDKEVADAGVKETGEMPSLTEEHIKAGIRHAPEIAPVPTEPQGSENLPMSQSQAQQESKGDTKDAVTWLANLVMRVFKKMKLNKGGV
jgi:hypothetical protein